MVVAIHSWALVPVNAYVFPGEDTGTAFSPLPSWHRCLSPSSDSDQQLRQHLSSSASLLIQRSICSPHLSTCLYQHSQWWWQSQRGQGICGPGCLSLPLVSVKMDINDFEQKGSTFSHLSQCESEVDLDYNLHILPIIIRVPSLSGLVLDPLLKCYSERLSKD